VAIEVKDVAVWNVVPWYIGSEERKRIREATTADVRSGLKYLIALIASMPQLECIVLVGGAARKANVFLSQTTTVHILSCHRPSARALTANPRLKRMWRCSSLSNKPPKISARFNLEVK